MITVVIPARGGSKGLPGKNLALVGGRPLVGRAVSLGMDVLRQTGSGGEVVCSTDDPSIAATALAWGAQVPSLRPEELATDSATSVDVVLHVLEELMITSGTVLLLQPTSPLTKTADVLEGLRMHQESGDSVVSVRPLRHPLEWKFFIDGDSRLRADRSEITPTRRQQASSAVELSGAFYIVGAEQLRKERTFFGPSTRAIVIPSDQAIDVDTAQDLREAQRRHLEGSSQQVRVGDRVIGPGNPVFFIAEAGVNHNGDLDLAKALVEKAAEAGADAVKFQTFRSEAVVSPEAPQAEYQVRNTAKRESQLEMLRRLELEPGATSKLRDYCEGRGIMFLSTPCDPMSADLLDEMDVPAFKVGSGELTNHLFLRHLAEKGRPIILSTGMSTLDEVSAAVRMIKLHGDPPLCLLHCVSSYPAAPEECNLRAMGTLRQAFSCPVGWSDHTLGTETSIAAVAIGAELVEKHFTLDRSLPGPDHRASLEPEDLTQLVKQIGQVGLTLGNGEKWPQPSESNTAAAARRSVHAARGIEAGKTLSLADMVVLRPGTGIPADRVEELVGRRAARVLSSGQIILESDIE